MTDKLLEFSPPLPSASNSGRTLVTVRLIWPDEVLMVLIRTLGITGAVPVGEAGDSLLLHSLVTLQGLSGSLDNSRLATSRADSCSGWLSGGPGLSLATLGDSPWGLTGIDSFWIKWQSETLGCLLLVFFALRAAMAAIQEESLAEVFALAWETLRSGSELLPDSSTASVPCCAWGLVVSCLACSLGCTLEVSVGLAYFKVPCLLFASFLA